MAVWYLIDKGADVNATDNIGMTPLHFNCLHNGGAATAKRLISEGADVNAKTRYGTTPLILAANHAKTYHVVSILCNAGADVNAMDKSGTTPLIAAFLGKPMMIESGTVPIIVECLIKRGADVNVSDEDGRTLLMKCCYTEGDTTDPQPSRFKVTKMLIEAGLDVNARDHEGETALMSHAASTNIDTVKLLIEAGADVNAKTDPKRAYDEDGWARSERRTALWYAYLMNDYEYVKRRPVIVKILKAAGAKKAVY